MTESAAARERRGEGTTRWWEYLDIPFGGSGEGAGSLLLWILALLLVVVFMIFVGVPLILFLAEVFLITIPLLVAGLLARILFRRPWILVATAPDERTHTWSVVGWRASTRALREMERDIAAGPRGGPIG